MQSTHADISCTGMFTASRLPSARPRLDRRVQYMAAVVLVLHLMSLACGLTPPIPSPGQLALMQRGYETDGAADTNTDSALRVPSMGAERLPGLTMFMHFGPCTFMSTGCVCLCVLS